MLNKRLVQTLCTVVIGMMGTSLWAQPIANTASAGSNTLKIGIVFPLTGGSADFGQSSLNGIQLAVDEINELGGYLGRRFELLIKDDKSDPEIGIKASQELVKEQAIATIGFCNTAVAIKAIPIFQQNQMPLLVSCATGSPVTKIIPPDESYIFRVAPSETIMAPFVTKDIIKRGWTKVAIFHDKTAYGTSGRDDVIAALAKYKLQPSYIAEFELGVKDLAKEINAAKALGANVIFTYTVGPENAVIAKSRDAMGWKVPLVGSWPLSFFNFITQSGKSAEGSMMAQSFIAEPSNERRVAFLTAYAKKYKSPIPIPMAAAQGYDATYLTLYALFSVKGELNGAKLKTALEDLRRPYYGVTTTYIKPWSLNDKEAVTSNMLVMGVVKNGAVTFLYPEDAKRNLYIHRKQ
jgi:branched-chain amino acid transport system substrate-binding protein